MYKTQMNKTQVIALLKANKNPQPANRIKSLEGLETYGIGLTIL
jgi:hypothetical protein